MPTGPNEIFPVPMNGFHMRLPVFSPEPSIDLQNVSLVKRCTARDHQGENPRPVSDFYERRNICKDCYKIQQKAGRDARAQKASFSVLSLVNESGVYQHDNTTDLKMNHRTKITMSDLQEILAYVHELTRRVQVLSERVNLLESNNGNGIKPSIPDALPLRVVGPLVIPPSAIETKVVSSDLKPVTHDAPNSCSALSTIRRTSFSIGTAIAGDTTESTHGS